MLLELTRKVTFRCPGANFVAPLVDQAQNHGQAPLKKKKQSLKVENVSFGSLQIVFTLAIPGEFTVHSPSRSVAQPSFPTAKMIKFSGFCSIK